MTDHEQVKLLTDEELKWELGHYSPPEEFELLAIEARRRDHARRIEELRATNLREARELGQVETQNPTWIRETFELASRTIIYDRTLGRFVEQKTDWSKGF